MFETLYWWIKGVFGPKEPFQSSKIPPVYVSTPQEPWTIVVLRTCFCYWLWKALLRVFIPAAAPQGASGLDKLIKLRFSWPMECGGRQLGCGRAARSGCYFSGLKWPPGKTRGRSRGGGRREPAQHAAHHGAFDLLPAASLLPSLCSVILWLFEHHQPPIYYTPTLSGCDGGR